MRLNGLGLLFIAVGVGWVIWQCLKTEDAPVAADDEPVEGRVYEFPMTHVHRAQAAPFDWERDA